MTPSLFIAHGAPLLAIQDNEYTRFLKDLGKTMKRPKAVVLFSAHWESPIQKVSLVEKYETLYDFGGFSEELYKIRYPAKGHTGIAERIEGLLNQVGVASQPEKARGLDHGAWVVLRLLYPKADVPVVAMSVNQVLNPVEQYEIGKALAELRKDDVLIIGSGGTVHNLGAVNLRKDDGFTDEWAIAFDDWLADKVDKWDLESLFHYQTLAPNAEIAVPPFGKEHFVPLFYSMGAADDSRSGRLLHRSYQYGNLSHSVWQFG